MIYRYYRTRKNTRCVTKPTGRKHNNLYHFVQSIVPHCCWKNTAVYEGTTKLLFASISIVVYERNESAEGSIEEDDSRLTCHFATPASPPK